MLAGVPWDAEAVGARRDKLIAAMAETAKPYFGDVAEMTYLQWLRRYVDLSIGDGDSQADTASPATPWLDIAGGGAAEGAAPVVSIQVDLPALARLLGALEG